jgi:hypothetical protein
MAIPPIESLDILSLKKLNEFVLITAMMQIRHGHPTAVKLFTVISIPSYSRFAIRLKSKLLNSAFELEGLCPQDLN